MRSHLEAFIGAGWDQLLALMTIVATMSASATGVILFFLRFRLGKYFVTRPDQTLFSERLAQEHLENKERLKALEAQVEQLATKHSLNGIAQRQDSLSGQMANLQVSHAELQGEIKTGNAATERVEHMMHLVLENLLQREKS